MQLACKASRAGIEYQTDKTNRKKERQTNKTKRLFVANPTVDILQY